MVFNCPRCQCLLLPLVKPVVGNVLWTWQGGPGDVLKVRVRTVLLNSVYAVQPYPSLRRVFQQVMAGPGMGGPFSLLLSLRRLLYFFHYVDNPLPPASVVTTETNGMFDSLGPHSFERPTSHAHSNHLEATEVPS